MALPDSLSGWLSHIERQHPSAIALGLDRVREVLARLEAPIPCPVFTVGGTNGKGSVCAMLESILRVAGYRTGLYLSPHLVRFNERVQLCGRQADDAALCEAFAAVEAARGGVPLTYFEFATLAAFRLFAREALEAVVLEVGLGGRLDAVNVLDADCAVLTSVAIDHVEYLGDTREAIGREKAGIFRAHRPAVVADPDPPLATLQTARELGARLLLAGRDFGYERAAGQWRYWGPEGRRGGLAHPALRGRAQLGNAAAALCALGTLRERLPVAMQDVRRGLAEVTLPGRFQTLPGRPRVVLDVAHNPQAACELAENLAASGYAARTLAVCGMLRDKDHAAVLGALAPSIERWHFATLAAPRGASAEQLAAHLAALCAQVTVSKHDSVAHAYRAALDEAGPDDKIVVFGSFLTVGEVMQEIERRRGARDG